MEGGEFVPFSKQTPRAYTRANVFALGEDQIGVYGLFRKNDWIYIGKGDIRQRLLDHLNGDKPCITKAMPTHWVAELWPKPDARMSQLINELKPSCNKKV